MKKLKKLSALFLTVLLLLSCMTITAYAAERETQDGLSAVIETDKESYEANEPISVTVTVTNNNSFAMKNVSIESILPASLTIQNGTLKSDTVDLEAGEELTLTFTAVLEKDVPPVTEPGTSEPDTSEPDTSEPDTTEPTVTDPSEPDTSEPDTSEPDTTEPVVTEPSTSEPDTTEPTVTEPTVTNPTTQPTTENPTAAGEVTTTTLTPETTTAVNAADRVNGTSPITGAPAVALKVLLVVAMVAAVAFAVVMLTRKNGKKATKIISVVLSAAICVSALATTGMIAKAEENTRSFSVEKTITVDGEPETITGNIYYDNKEVDKDIEIYNKPTSEENVKELDNGMAYISNELLITAKPGVEKSEIEQLVKQYNGGIIGYISLTDDYQAYFPEVTNYADLKLLANKLSESELIISADINYVFKMDIGYYPSDPYGGDNWSTMLPDGKNWGLEAINAPAAWAYRDNFSPVNIGIIDTMFDTSHEDLNFVSEGVWNNPTNVAQLYSDNPDEGNYYHGTLVAGIASAIFDNNKGISGTAPNTNLYAYAMHGDTNYSGLMDWKVAFGKMFVNGVKVINISLWSPDLCDKASQGDQDIIDSYNSLSEIFANYLERWLDSGYDFVICQIAGNGNEGKSYDVLAKYSHFLTNIEEERIKDRIIVVGAAELYQSLFSKFDRSYKLTNYSNVGDRVDVIAPGENIYSCFPNNSYNSIGGTSMASPIVAGIAAMIWGANSSLTGSEVKWIITHTSFDEVSGTNVKMANANIAVKTALGVTGSSESELQHNNGIINGTVTSFENHPVENAWISIMSKNDNYDELVYHEETDVLGEFSAILPEGKYKISIWHPDFEEVQDIDLEIKSGEAIFKSFYLTAKFAGGDGTIENPYQVSTPEQLNAVRYDLDAHYIQINDIDMSDWGNWEPIGNAISIWGTASTQDPIHDDHYFMGTYDGKNHSISNLTLDDNKVSVTEDCFGLFAGLKNATVKNLQLNNIEYNVDKQMTDYASYWNNESQRYSLSVGGISGRCNSATITNCSVNGKINVINCSDAYVGGIAGIGDTVTLCNSNTAIYVSATKDSIEKKDSIVQCGGIVGQSSTSSELFNCNNKGNITVIAGYYVRCGGISGLHGKMQYCLNYGNIDGNVINQSGSTLYGGTSNVGGIVGVTDDDVLYCVNYGSISSCTKTNEQTIKHLTSYAGGIVGYCGYNGNGNINNCYNLNNNITSNTKDKDDNLIPGDLGRIAGYSIKIGNCYSVNTTTLNGTLPTEYMQADQKNGASLTKEEMEEKIAQIDFGNMPT